MNIFHELFKSCLTLSQLDADKTLNLFDEIKHNHNSDNKIFIKNGDKEIIFYINHFQLIMHQAPVFKETVLMICNGKGKHFKIESIDENLSKLFLTTWCIGRLENDSFARIIDWSSHYTAKTFKQILWNNNIEISYERVHQIKCMSPNILEFKTSL